METIRKPPLVEVQNAVGKQKKYGEERFLIWRPFAILNFRGLILWVLSKAHVEMHKTEYGNTRIILGHFPYVCYSRYVWYTSCILVHQGQDQCLVYWASFPVSIGKFGSLRHTLHLVRRLVHCVGSRFVGTPSSFLTYQDRSWSLQVRLVQSLRLVHQLHFGKLGTGSVFNRLGIIFQ